MLTTSFPRLLGNAVIACLVSAVPTVAQTGAKNGEWRSYGGDTGNTRYTRSIGPDVSSPAPTKAT